MKGFAQDVFPTLTTEKVVSTSSVHLWSVIGDLVTSLIQRDPSPSYTVIPISAPGFSNIASKTDPSSKPWVWKFPDLSHGSVWYQVTPQKLMIAAAVFLKPEQIITEGEALPDIHHTNYGPEGVQQLVLLWW
jgi:hypothetical protein